MGIYLPHGFEPLTAQHLVERYTQIIDEIDQEIFNDYVDNLEFNTSNPVVFDIDYIPAMKNLRFYINGVFYLEDVHYKLDRENKKITWLFTKENGGFKPEPHYKYMAIYDIYLSDNGLENADELIQVNN
jgi:hypothetical protein